MTLEASYQALRYGAGALELPRDVIEVVGPDAESYLQGQLSQDISGLEKGSSVESLVLSPQGKLVALVRVTKVHEDRFVIDVEAGHGQEVLERLRKFLLRVKVELTELPWSCICLRGPHCSLAVEEATSNDVVVLPFSWNGVIGIDVIGEDPRNALSRGSELVWCEHGALEALRVEAGIPAMGKELTTKTIPAEVGGLVERAVSFTKGCYTGQELVARLAARGSKVSRRLCGVIVEGSDPPRPKAALFVGSKEVGQITSAAWSFALGAPCGLAYLHRSIDVPQKLDIEMQGTAKSAEARELPLA